MISEMSQQLMIVESMSVFREHPLWTSPCEEEGESQNNGDIWGHGSQS